MECRLNVMRALQRVDDFLDSLISLLANALSLDPGEMNENSFVDLFQEFAKIFCVKFRSCGVKRFLKLGQSTIFSRNDLRFDFAPADNMVDNLDIVKQVVVTVAEVKQNVKKRDTSSTPPKKKLRSTDTLPASQPITSDYEKYESDVGSPDCLEFPPCLRGQHGIELLADVENSCLEPTLTNSMILGMTVEATFVRLTCLDIELNAFKKIQEQEPQNAVKRIGTIYYTKAFDMLMRDGRKNLIFIMRYLLLLSKNHSAKWLPRD
ncbi:uncharacterized protein LOC135498061 isoform X2 [Lineus longissimus]|uniref:uncharacterized protein LOC135498061 isoform X2 n=1 Tax=Lineus longissimus TaxID=88925 RepID=UPI00315DD5AA